MGEYTGRFIQNKYTCSKCYQYSNTRCTIYRQYKESGYYFFCAQAVIKGEMTFGVMISTQFIIGMLNGPVQQFIQFIISFQFAKISFLRLNEIHELRDEHQDVGNNSIDLPESKNLLLSNVMFQYTPNSPLVLKGINLFIPEKR